MMKCKQHSKNSIENKGVIQATISSMELFTRPREISLPLPKAGAAFRQKTGIQGRRELEVVMTHTNPSSKNREPVRTPNRTNDRASQGAATTRISPGTSEPGHIKPIGPAHRADSSAPNPPESNQTTGE
jgi:hypothetical protein